MIQIDQRAPDQWSVYRSGFLIGRIFSTHRPQFFAASQEEAFTLPEIQRITRFMRRLERKATVLA